MRLLPRCKRIKGVKQASFVTHNHAGRGSLIAATVLGFGAPQLKKMPMKRRPNDLISNNNEDKGRKEKRDRRFNLPQIVSEQIHRLLILPHRGNNFSD